MFRRIQYAVSADYDLLRHFTNRSDAELYAQAVVACSHPNIGVVRIERYSEEAEMYVTLASYGYPRGSLELEAVPLS